VPAPAAGSNQRKVVHTCILLGSDTVTQVLLSHSR